MITFAQRKKIIIKTLSFCVCERENALWSTVNHHSQPPYVGFEERQASFAPGSCLNTGYISVIRLVTLVEPLTPNLIQSLDD